LERNTEAVKEYERAIADSENATERHFLQRRLAGLVLN
jgi:predicted RNA polymerase sigma factor